MLYDALFIFGLFVAPVLIGTSALGFLLLAAMPKLNANHTRARHVLGVVLITGCTAALLLGITVSLSME